MADRIKRDAAEMKRFAQKAKDYNEEVEKYCTQMKNDLKTAYYAVGRSDRELSDAIDSLNQMEQAIRKNLPLVVEASTKLVKSATFIEEAKNILKR